MAARFVRLYNTATMPGETGAEREKRELTVIFGSQFPFLEEVKKLNPTFCIICSINPGQSGRLRSLNLAILHLYLNQTSIETMTLEQPIMCALLYNTSLIQYQDEVGIVNRT
jgi:hypothetical protein